MNTGPGGPVNPQTWRSALRRGDCDRANQIDLEPLVSMADCLDVWRRLNGQRATLKYFEQELYVTVCRQLCLAMVVAVRVMEEEPDGAEIAAVFGGPS